MERFQRKWSKKRWSFGQSSENVMENLRESGLKRTGGVSMG